MTIRRLSNGKVRSDVPYFWKRECMYLGCFPLTSSTRNSIFVHLESQVPGRFEIGSCLERTHSYSLPCQMTAELAGQVVHR